MTDLRGPTPEPHGEPSKPSGENPTLHTLAIQHDGSATVSVNINDPGKSWFRVWSNYVQGGFLANLSPATSKIYFALCSYANKNWIAWPGSETLAKKAGVSRNTVFKAVRQLEEAGIIVKKCGRGKRSNVYTILCPKGANDPTLVQHNSLTPSQIIPGGHSNDPTGIHELHLRTKEQHTDEASQGNTEGVCSLLENEAGLPKSISKKLAEGTTKEQVLGCIALADQSVVRSRTAFIRSCVADNWRVDNLLAKKVSEEQEEQEEKNLFTEAARRRKADEARIVDEQLAIDTFVAKLDEDTLVEAKATVLSRLDPMKRAVVANKDLSQSRSLRNDIFRLLNDGPQAE